MRRVKRVLRIAIDLGNSNLKIAIPALCALALGVVLAAHAQENPRQQQTPASTSAAPENANAASTVAVAPVVTAKPKGRAFRSPQTAAATLCHAARHDDETELMAILGPDSKDILQPDDEQKGDVQEQRQWFVAKYDQMHRLVHEPDNTVALYVGPENWPFPIPIVEYDGSWYFATDLGKQEIVFRRVGRNEIEALDVCKALIDAEKEYAASAHTFTAKFTSSANAHDGLYWKGGDSNGSRSPVGPYLAQAGVADAGSAGNSRPFHGYLYRILLDRSGSAGGHFVVVAFPAMYRSSGVMTFVMDQDGVAHEKDLGSGTSQAAMQLDYVLTDDSWKKVE